MNGAPYGWGHSALTNGAIKPSFIFNLQISVSDLPSVEFWIGDFMRNRHGLLLTLSFLLAPFCASQMLPIKPPPSGVRPPRVDTAQEIILPMAGFRSSDQVLFMLNNNRSGTMPIAVTAYTLDGRAIPLPTVQLVSRESWLTDLQPTLQAAEKSNAQIGFLKLAYTGQLMELGAQLTLYTHPGATGFDSPRSLAADFKSHQRSAAFIVPNGGRAKLALTNVGTSSMQGVVRCNGITQPFILAPSATYLFDPVGVLEGASTGVACDVVSDGTSTDLRAFGYVTRGDYAAPVRFYDPATATSSGLTAVSIQSAFDAIAAVHNTSNHPVVITPQLVESAIAPQSENTLPSITLPPFGSIVLPLNLGRFRANSVPYVNLNILTDAPKGAVVGALTQTDSNDIVEDIPLRTSNPPRFDRGSYPLRWSDDYKNLVSITNTASEARGYRATITAGDIIYVFKKVTLDPGATMIYDVDALRSGAVPDLYGQKLPKDAPYGKFLWSELSEGKTTGLIGRVSLSSEQHHRRSSFSCGAVCDETDEIFPFISGFPGTLHYGQPVGVSIYEEYGSVNQPYYTYPYLASDFISLGMPYTTPSNMVSFSTASGSSDPYTAIFAAIDIPSESNELSSGSPDIYLEWTVTYEYFNSYLGADGSNCTDGAYSYLDNENGDNEPQVNIDNNASDANIGVGQSYTLHATGTPAGGSYTWDAGGSTAVSLTPGVDPSYVTVKGIQAGQALVTVTYSYNNGSDTDDQTANVAAATVVNFRQTIGRDNGNGVIAFQYNWDSSTGNLQDLGNCTVREYVTYPGPNPYPFPSPPYAPFSAQNPTAPSTNATGGVGIDLHSPGNGFQTPYTGNTFTASQKYQFSCSDYKGGAWIDLLTGISIVRTVSQNSPGSTWRYDISKSGVSASINPLP